MVKFFVIFLLDGSVFYQARLKLTLMGLLVVSWFCYLWRYFPWEYERVYWCFLCVSWSSDCYDCWVLWNYTFYGGSSKDRAYYLNVILPWFVLRLLLGLMFRGCFVIDEILVLTTAGKSVLGLLTFFVKGMCVLISWLI